MADGEDDWVHAGGRLSQEGRQLGDDWGQEGRAPELPDHGDGGIGRPGEQPDADVGDGHFGDAHFRAVSVLVLVGPAGKVH